jgi:1,4-alpha-glucan branching enzyme
MSKKMKAPAPTVRHDFSLLSDDDLYLFNEGNQFRLYLKLGSHLVREQGETGTYFAVWAPDAKQVFVTGDFNRWHRRATLAAAGPIGHLGRLHPRSGAGLLCKYHIVPSTGIPGGQSGPLRRLL